MSSKAPYSQAVMRTAATNALLGGIGFITSIMAARILGVEGRGELAAIQIWPTIIAAIAALGLTEALVFFSASHPRRTGRYLGTALMLALLASVVAIAVGYQVIPVALSGQSEEVVSSSRWYLGFIPLSVALSFAYSVLRGSGHFAAWNIARAFSNSGWLFVLMLAWAISRATPTFVAMTYLVTLFLLVFPITLMVRKNLEDPIIPDRELYHPLIQYGLPSLLAVVLRQTQSRFDQIVLAISVEPHLLGLYVVALGWTSAAEALLHAIGAITFPKVAGSPDSVSRVNALTSTIRASVVIAFLIGSVGSLATPWAFPLLFGKAYEAAVGPALILIWSATATGLNYVIMEGLRGFGKPRDVLVAESIGAAVSVLSVIVLLPLWSIAGAASAVLLGSLSTGIVLILRVVRATHTSLAIVCVPTREDVRRLASRIRNMISTIGLSD